MEGTAAAATAGDGTTPTVTTKDCLSCRLISFCGLTGSGIYVAYHARKQKGVFSKSFLGAFAAGLAYLGMARGTRLLPPFRPQDRH